MTAATPAENPLTAGIDSTRDPQAVQPLSLAEINNIVSVQLKLPPELEVVVQLSPRVEQMVNQSPDLRSAGAEGVRTVLTSIMPEDRDRMDPMKQAEAMLARANITSSDSAAWAKVLENFRLVSSGRLAGDDASRAQAEASLSVLDLGKIDQTNFAFTEFSTKAGLSYGAFSELRGQGFNAQQIMAAASFTKEMGLDVNKDAAVVARLQRDQPDANPAMRDMRDKERGLAEAKKKLAEAEAKPETSAEDLARLRTRVQELQTYADDYHKGYHTQAETRKPGSGEDVDKYRGRQQVVNKTLKAATADMAPEQAADVQQAFEEFHRHPEDAAVRKRYKDTLAQYQNPKLEQQLAKAGETRGKMAATTQRTQTDTAETENRNEAKQVKKDDKATPSDDMLASLNGPTPEPGQQPETAPTTPSKPLRTARNTKATTPSQPTA